MARCRIGQHCRAHISAVRPLRDHGVVRMRRDEQWHGDTRVDGCGRHRPQRRPASMRANIISSVTTVSALAAKRQSSYRSSRAVPGHASLAGSVVIRSSDHLDRALDARRSRQACVGGDQDKIQAFGQRDIGSVVRSHDGAESPDTGQQWMM